MEEMIPVYEAVNNIATAWFWLGGKYNSTSGKYYWIGSGVDADVAAMFESYPPTGKSDYNLVMERGNRHINAYWSIISFNMICEEY